MPAPPLARLESWQTFTIWCVALLVIAFIWFIWAIGYGWWLLLLACLAAIYFGSPVGSRALADAVRRFQRSRNPATYYLTAKTLTVSHGRPATDVDTEDNLATIYEAGNSAALQPEGQPDELTQIEPALHPSQRLPSPSPNSPPSQLQSLDDLVTIRSAISGPITSSISPPPLVPATVPQVTVASTGSPQQSRIEFLGTGSTLELDRGKLPDALIFLTPGTLREAGEPSCVELGLPIGRGGITPGQEPPTWPTYRSFNPSQRAFYIDWLLQGRRQPIPLPYVTLYLYGLERRILVDALDHDAIARELIGLSQAYGTAYSFRRDVSALLWLTIDLSGDATPVARSTFDAAVLHTQEWNAVHWRHCLAAMANQKWRVPLDLALRIAAEDPRTVNSTVVKRHNEMFRTIFEKRLSESFPEGLTLSTAGRAEKIDYLILNPSLNRLPRTETHLTARSRVPADSPEIDKLVDVWERCVADLKVYDRVHRTAESGPLTSEMWEALPEISRQEAEHPESEAWQALLQQAMHQHGRPLLAVSELAKIKQIEPRGRLTKKQSEQLVKTASCLQLAIEPDVRLTGKAYGWDDVVAVFPRRDTTAEDLAAYQAAAILLRMGMHIAAADGAVDETELGRITAHLEQQFELSSTAADRLEHLRYALVHSPSTTGLVEKSLQEKLQPEQRQVVGEFLVGIAVADGTISPAELKALKKAWNALDLPAKSLDELIRHPAGAGVDQPVVLDQDRISQIMLDTQRVAVMLKEAMSVDEDQPDEVPAASPSVAVAIPPVQVTPDAPLEPSPTTSVAFIATNWEGLPPRYHDFLRRMLAQPVWPRRDLDSLARSQQLMLGGALEAINEWTHENHGDWLTSEEGDEIHVQQGLLAG